MADKDWCTLRAKSPVDEIPSVTSTGLMADDRDVVEAIAAQLTKPDIMASQNWLIEMKPLAVDRGLDRPPL